MNHPPTRRAFIAWALYFSVLFNVFSCGLGHGQMLGLALNGIGKQFCSLGSDTSALAAKDLSALPDSGLATPFSCPLCAAGFIHLVFLVALAWLLSNIHRRAFARAPLGHAPPRYCWPSSNPRASPR
ncbi:DUF2946 domain-containing protein [Pseudomonas juntendi]|uniref:DUF2946 domain-containing protein n=1 Tax=Pseudomonas juntendi TaxID=2666183 RepID=UPI00244CB246|nr:DUF2946 domain-containing protein [Pseudomonas juntendi]MDG9873063.1 DUF2946 domain-containing protein [Pseudomonas juntendi]